MDNVDNCIWADKPKYSLVFIHVKNLFNPLLDLREHVAWVMIDSDENVLAEKDDRHPKKFNPYFVSNELVVFSPDKQTVCISTISAETGRLTPQEFDLYQLVFGDEEGRKYLSDMLFELNCEVRFVQ